ncbi:MAG TPA: hypothetical protein VFA84_13950 [Acidimicrobiales bacterium]|nr:hypothetical protein [Acidimicrobiales bacterium]
MLFEQRFWPLIADGSVTVTFRRWRRPQARAGRRQRTPAGIIEIDGVDVVDPASVSDEDAARAGYEDAASLLAGLRGRPGDPVYRIAFHAVHEPDPRSVLAASDRLAPEDITEIDRRLDRLDRASSHGAWAREVLAEIAARPGVRAPDLAASFGRETQPFKADVRKLKNLGLTISLKVGYELSPRGNAYLAARQSR